MAVVEGSDAQLKNTYVAFGAHYDHVGYAEGEVVTGDGARRRLGAPGRVTPGAENDRIWNGADDDGSGTVALLALARAVRPGAAAQTVAAVRLACGRGARAARVAIFRGLSDRAARPHRRAVEHRHDRAEPRQQAERVQHRVSRRFRSHQHRARRDQPRGQRQLAQADAARLRVQRPERSRVALHAKRSLQLRIERDSDHFLHDRAASRLSREHRRGVEDRVRQDDAHRAARVRDRGAGGEPRSRAGARQQGLARDARRQRRIGETAFALGRVPSAAPHVGASMACR